MARSTSMPAIVKYVVNLRAKIVGRTIKEFGLSDDGQDILAIVLDDGAILWVQSDPEGNGSGHLAYQKGE